MNCTFRMFLGNLIGLIGLTFAAGIAAAQQPAPPWPAGDERGMANAIGPETWGRCAEVLSRSNAKAYEVSHLRSGTMPLSRFAGPLRPRSPSPREVFRARPT